MALGWEYTWWLRAYEEAEVDNNSEWLVGPCPQREAAEAYTLVLGESRKALRKWEREAWPISISLGLLGFQHESHYLTSCPHLWKAAFRTASGFLVSCEEAANKPEREFLCTSVTILRDHREI